jgi:hypothetical protein
MLLAARTYLKFHVPCTFEFQISVTPYLQSTILGVSLSGLGGKTPTAGAPGRGDHCRSLGELDGNFQLHRRTSRGYNLRL